MKVNKCILRLLCAGFVGVTILLTGCGGDKAMVDLETRLKALEDKGTPDSVLSSARVDLENAKAGKQRGDGTAVQASIDSLKVHVAAAEKWAEGVMQVNKDRADSLAKVLADLKNGLTGMQLKEADSLYSLIDSYIKKAWYLQARAAADHLDSLMPSLLKDEDHARQTSGKIVGVWSMVKQHREDGANEVEKNKISFMNDGTFEYDEQMKGQTNDVLKEDWQFISHGNYGLKGDTILLMTQNEKCLRQIYWNLNDKNQWVKNEKAPYDSVIKDGSKDRSIAFSYLKENYRK
jgi:hypothetical protein